MCEAWTCVDRVRKTCVAAANFYEFVLQLLIASRDQSSLGLRRVSRDEVRREDLESSVRKAS